MTQRPQHCKSKYDISSFDVPYHQTAENLRACREAADLSRAELAEISGVSLTAIRSIEVSDTLNPLVDTIVALSRTLGVKVDQLVGLMPLGSRPTPDRGAP